MVWNLERIRSSRTKKALVALLKTQIRRSVITLNTSQFLGIAICNTYTVVAESLSKITILKATSNINMYIYISIHLYKYTLLTIKPLVTKKDLSIATSPPPGTQKWKKKKKKHTYNLHITLAISTIISQSYHRTEAYLWPVGYFDYKWAKLTSCIKIIENDSE